MAIVATMWHGSTPNSLTKNTAGTVGKKFLCWEERRIDDLLSSPPRPRRRLRLAGLADQPALVVGAVIFSRAFAMPSRDTFSIKPIGEFVARWIAASPGKSIDPFARNNQLADWRNDLDPTTSAPFHIDAADFCRETAARGARCSLALNLTCGARRRAQRYDLSSRAQKRLDTEPNPC